VDVCMSNVECNVPVGEEHSESVLFYCVCHACLSAVSFE
jgi:hypothetical protein